MAGALDPSMIDALLADAKTTGTPIDGVDGLLNQMTKAVLERALQAEMTHELGYARDDPAGAGIGQFAQRQRAQDDFHDQRAGHDRRAARPEWRRSSRRSCRNGRGGSDRSTR